MQVSVTDVSANQKKLQVEIPAERVQEEMDGRYRDLAKKVRIKGFRPGKVPRNIIKTYYGKTIESEVSSQFIQETFPQALREADLKPLGEAEVSEVHFEDNGAFTYSAVVDVCPPFELDGYKGLPLRRPAIEVSAEREEAELERVRQQHTQLRTLEESRPIQDGDVVLLDFVPHVEGKVFEKGKTTDHMVEVGKQALHPDFDKHLIGHLPGDSFTFELDYPEDAPTPEIAGKRVHFDVTVKEIKEKVVPELNDDFAQEVGQFDTLDALKEGIRDQLRKTEEEKTSAEVRKQIVDRLLEKVTFDVSPKVIEREVDRMIALLQRQFEIQGLNIDTAKFDTPEIRTEYRPQAERNVRWHLIAERIAGEENITITDEDIEEIYNEVARLARMDAEAVKREYADSPIVEQAKDRKIQEKVFKWLEAESIYEEAPAEGEKSDKE